MGWREGFVAGLADGLLEVVLVDIDIERQIAHRHRKGIVGVLVQH